MLRKLFSFWGASTPEAELALRRLNVSYSKRADGSLVVRGELDLSKRNLSVLPNLSSVVVEGFFYCSDNRLTSLKGAPKSVSGNFYCENNQLNSLEGAPRHIGGQFYCQRNKLRNLQGAPETVKYSFCCGDNLLTSLQGAPQRVGGHFSCTNNLLTSLQGAPALVGDGFWCNGNQLRNLAFLPQSFKKLISDLGDYDSRSCIPASLLREQQPENSRIALDFLLLSVPTCVSLPSMLKRAP